MQKAYFYKTKKMIDTVRFQINTEKSIWAKLSTFGDGVFRVKKIDKNAPEKNLIFKSWNREINIGSFSSVINLYAPSEETCYLEFSLPKQLYRHNILLIDRLGVDKILDLIHKTIEAELGESFPPYKNWIVKRLDICYAWKLPNQEASEEVMKALQLTEYKGFQKQIWESGVSFKSKAQGYRGRAPYIKFYLKLPEFIKHDAPKLIKQGYRTFVEELKIMAQGVLRFEVELRSPMLEKCFGFKDQPLQFYLDNKFFWDNLDHDINYWLNHYLSLCTKMGVNMTNSYDVKLLLLKKYDKTKAGQLYIFWKSYFSDNPLDRKVIQETYSRSQIYRNLQDLKNAGVGIPKEDLKYDFDLSIPSTSEVNKNI